MLSCIGSQLDIIWWHNQILSRNRRKLGTTHSWRICLCISTNIYTKVVHKSSKDIGYADKLKRWKKVKCEKCDILGYNGQILHKIRNWKILVVHVCINMSWCIGTNVSTAADHSFTNDIRYGAKLNKFIMWCFGKIFRFFYASTLRNWNISVVLMYPFF